MEHKIHNCTYCIYWNIVCKVGKEGPAISHLVYCLILLLIMSLNQYLCPLCMFYAAFVKCIKQLLTVTKQSQVSFHAVGQRIFSSLHVRSISVHKSHHHTILLVCSLMSPSSQV